MLEIRVFIGSGVRAARAIARQSCARQLRARLPLLALAFLLIPSSALAQNLLQNGGFDSSLGGWTNPTSGPFAITTTWEAGKAKAVVGASGSGGVALQQGGLALTGGVSYEVGATMRLQAAGGSATVRVLATGGILAEASTGSTVDATVSAILYNTSSAAKTAEVWLMVPNNAGQAVWFDDALLRALPASAEFTASRTTIATGEPVTLTWATISAPQVSIDQGIGSQSRAGSVTVTPATTTTYALTASGPVGTVTKQLTVTVVPPPTATFSATPTTISEGEAAILGWTTTNATNISIDSGIGAVPTSGTRSVSPAATTTYTLTASGIGGSTMKQVTVTVTPPKPQISFAAAPRTIAEGESSTLSWTVLNATSVSIDHGIGNGPTTGSTSVSPATTTTYRLSATGPGGSSSAQVTVTVLAAPVITFTATPPSVTRGAASTLAWTVTDASLVVIDSGIGAQPPNGALEVRPTETTTYLLTAAGPGGVRLAQTTVTVLVSGRRRAVRH